MVEEAEEVEEEEVEEAEEVEVVEVEVVEVEVVEVEVVESNPRALSAGLERMSLVDRPPNSETSMTREEISVPTAWRILLSSPGTGAGRASEGLTPVLV